MNWLDIKQMIKSKHFWDGFWRGMASPFMVFADVFTPPKIYRERRERLYAQYDANQALKSDWEKIGQDMWKAIKQVENEIEKDKTSH